MADNIHEIAKIKAGDPVGIAKQNQAEAAALLEQYKHNKEKIDEINEAIKKWKEQSKKGKGLGLLGAFGGKFLSDALMNIFVPGSGMAPWVTRLISGLSSAATGGVAEKYRQDKYDATAALEKVEDKFKGSKIGEDVTDTLSLVEDYEENQLKSEVLGGLAAGVMFPGGTSEAQTGTISNPLTSGNLSKWTTPTTTPGVPGSNIVGKTLGGATLPTFTHSLNTMFGGVPLKGPMSQDILAGGIQNIPLVGSLIDDKGASKIANWFQEPGPQFAGRMAAPDLVSYLLGYEDRPTIGQYKSPTFRNPYRSYG